MRDGHGRERSPRRGGLWLGAVAVAIAGALPVFALAVATRSATREVRNTTFAGAQATATAVANQAAQEYEAAIDLVTRARTSPAVLGALRPGADPAALRELLPRFMAAGPLDAMAAYSPSGELLGAVPAKTGQVPALTDASVTGIREGPLVPRDDQTLRRVTVPVDDPATGSRLGVLVADIDLSRLIADVGALRFQQTGTSKLVGTDGRVVLSPESDIGMPLLAAENQRIARAHEPRTAIVYAPFHDRRTVEAYVPAVGHPFGVLTQQSEEEAFAGVRQLAWRLRELQIAFACIGLALGAATGVVVLRRDRRIEAQTGELRAAKALFTSAFDDAPSGAALVALDGRFLEVNAALCELTGFGREELLGRTVAEVTFPADVGETELLNARIAAGDLDGFDLDKRYLRADGEQIWVHVRTSVVHDAAGRAMHTIRHIVDITAQRQAADALRAALERERRAAEALRQLDGFRTDLLLTVSHDFRSPLAAITGYVSLLTDDWDAFDDDSRKAMFASIARSASELDRRVRSFLEYSRLDEVRVDLDPAACDVLAVTNAAIERTRHFLADDNVRVAIPSGMTVFADAEAFGRVLENLISNAGKYSPPGSTVAISAHRVDGEVIVQVDDEGPGIPADKAERIFERFYRATRDPGAPEGIGVGLLAVRQLTTMMGGRVWVESRPTGGSSFRVALPAVGAASLADETTAS